MYILYSTPDLMCLNSTLPLSTTSYRKRLSNFIQTFVTHSICTDWLPRYSRKYLGKVISWRKFSRFRSIHTFLFCILCYSIMLTVANIIHSIHSDVGQFWKKVCWCEDFFFVACLYIWKFVIWFLKRLHRQRSTLNFLAAV